MKQTNTPSEALELACRLADMMRKRVDKIARLSAMATTSIENGEVVMAQSPLALLDSEAEGLCKDVKDLFNVLNRLPEPGQRGSHHD
jgi:hypothetical protein